MAITFGFANQGDSSAGITTFNFASGGGTINSGNIIIIAATVQPSNLGGGVDPGSPLPSGFTQLSYAYDNVHTGYAFFVGYKVAGGSESGTYASATLAVTCTVTWGMVVYSGVGGSPVDASDTSGVAGADANTSIIAPTITATVANDMLVAIALHPGNGSPYTAFGAMTVRMNTVDTNGLGREILISEQQLSASGATGTRTATLTNPGGPSGFYDATMIALDPSTDTLLGQAIF